MTKKSQDLTWHFTQARKKARELSYKNLLDLDIQGSAEHKQVIRDIYKLPQPLMTFEDKLDLLGNNLINLTTSLSKHSLCNGNNFSYWNSSIPLPKSFGLSKYFNASSSIFTEISLDLIFALEISFVCSDMRNIFLYKGL